MKLRRVVIGRDCQIRLDTCNTEPCCLAHWRQIGISGMGMKSPDLIGAWACDNCHTRVDSTERHVMATQLDFARGVFRTQAILIEENGEPWK